MGITVVPTTKILKRLIVTQFSEVSFKAKCWRNIIRRANFMALEYARWGAPCFTRIISSNPQTVCMGCI